jgi:hypothetical protein
MPPGVRTPKSGPFGCLSDRGRGNGHAQPIRESLSIAIPTLTDAQALRRMPSGISAAPSRRSMMLTIAGPCRASSSTNAARIVRRVGSGFGRLQDPEGESRTIYLGDLRAGRFLSRRSTGFVREIAGRSRTMRRARSRFTHVRNCSVRPGAVSPRSDRRCQILR